MSRLDRIDSLLKKEISAVIQHKLDAKIGFLSITEVDVNKDLSHAKVYYSMIGSEEDKEKTHKALVKAAGYIKGEVGKVVRLKKIPTLRFIYDNSLERGNVITQKINSLD